MVKLTPLPPIKEYFTLIMLGLKEKVQVEFNLN